MDYDDNDFQSQNLHLAGEGSTKFPPVLRPYPLPKFDFDESLQGNLRFDSLVETEVFLGIESNEDNQWIDSFSRGGSGIEFSSTAAESCSISRHVNVWSEATSSESVEMLLKSVGQEDYIPRQTVIQESDASDQLACLAGQMDPNPKPVDKNELKDVTELQPPAGICENLSGLKEDVGIEQSQSGVPRGDEVELSIDDSSGNLELNDICKNIDLPVSGGNPSLYTGDESDHTNKREVETVADESHDDKKQDDPSVCGVQTNITEKSMHHMSDKQQCPLTEPNKQHPESSMMNIGIVVAQTLDGNPVGGDAYHADKSLCSTSTVEALEGGSLVEGLETGASSLEHSMGVGSAAISGLQKAERCSEDLCPADLSRASASEDVVLLDDGVMDDQSELKACSLPKVSNDDSVSKGHVVEDGNSDCGICPTLHQNVDVVERKTYGDSSVSKENELLKTGDHLYTEILSSKSEASVFTAVENNISTVSEGNSDNRVGDSSSFILAASSMKSPTLCESTQICENVEPDGQTDHEKFNQDASVNDQDSKRTPSNSSQILCDVDQPHLVHKGAGSSFVTAGSMETELITSTVSINVVPGNNSASPVISENISLASCEATDTPAPSGKDVSTHEDTGHNAFLKTTPIACSSANEKEESEAKIDEKAGSTSAGSSEHETAPCPISETEKHHSSDISGQIFCEAVNGNVGTSGSLKFDEPQGTLDGKTQECTKEIVMHPVPHELTEKPSDGNVVSVVKDDKETLQYNHDKSSSKILGNDILLGNKDSISSAPFPDSSIELQQTGSFPTNNNSSPSSTFGSPSQTEKDENQVKASANPKTPVSELTKSGAENNLSTVQDLKGNNTSKDERSLPPEVNPVADLSRKDVPDVIMEDVIKSQSVPVAAANKESTAVEGSPSTSGIGLPNTKNVENVSQGSPKISDREVTNSVSKATPERKTRRASSKTAGKESSRKGSRVKDTTPRQSKRGSKSTNLSLTPSPGFQMVQSHEVQQYGHIDSNSSKSFALVSASTSSIPDLNTSASPPVLFHQPFTDLQQVQLRAQIFVYGALIQGLVPDETHMISAFGGPDGGRSVWENAWRACMERQHSQRSHPINPETPVHSRSGARASDSAAKQSAVQGKAISSPLGQSSSKATSALVNPVMPLSSPLWNLPTPSHDSLQSSAIGRGSVGDYPLTHTSMHSLQIPPLRNFLGHNTSWISQASIRGPWITSPTPALDNRTHLSASTVSDTIKLSSIKESCLPPSSGMKNVSPGLPTPSTGLQSISVGTATLHDANIVTVSPSQHSIDPKPKKRKKVVVSEDPGHKALQSLTPVSNHTSTSVAIVTPVRNVPITTAEKSVVSVSPLADHLKSDRNVQKRILSDESLMKVKEAKVHAEEATALSTAAVNHSLEIWNQLSKCSSSGLTSDIEAELASAAVAIAAAAAVAKAAAAAANVASNAAIQAKLMAEEALISSDYENSSQSNKISVSEGTSNFGKATPASILKGANGSNSPGSIIGAAKEAVRRRVEAASAATKRAENMDAIVKAAELAAEAVSQAGKIVTMGDPLPLSDLVEAGPEGFWKSTQESSHQVGLLNDISRDLVNIREIPEASHTHKRDLSSGVISTSVNINEKSFRGPRGHKKSDLDKPVVVIPESEPEIQASLTVSNGSENLEETNIKEGSLVEVFKDEEEFKAAWFPANIVTLKDGKAYVCYTSLAAVEGAGPLKEWVSVDGEGDKPPRIRTTRPLTGLHHEGTRKRRRAATGEYAWSVGDSVDAWMLESWHEGVITEKNKKDETTLTVHFPASGETKVVRSWHLRPSCIWKDGKWIESSKANDSSTHEGDTPNEKRPKLGSPAVEVKGKDKMPKSSDALELANPDELRLLNLTENEKVFNIGKSAKNENRLDTHRMARSGLQKEASGVVFGVPKPGKKRKFMEVSKHYDVAHGSSKANDRNDSVKLANFVTPQGSGSRIWKNSSKIDSKDKPADFKPKPYKSGKPQSVVGRVIPPKDSSSNAFALTTDQISHTGRNNDSSIHVKNASQNESLVERAPYSATDRTAEGPIVFSSRARSTDTLPTKRASTSRASKGKLAPARGKLVKGEVEKTIPENPVKSTSDVNEPRRSNRRIQPTSRLLEGLQSSLIISKIPSVSHNRNHSKGNNQG